MNIRPRTFASLLSVLSAVATTVSVGAAQVQVEVTLQLARTTVHECEPLWVAFSFINISVETCPHYLCLEAEAVPDGATVYKCAPPIRGHDNREALWQGLLDGIIDFVISDHSPCVPSLKLPEQGDFMGAWGGIASLQLGLSAIWTEARLRGASFEQLARWLSTAPAEFAGLGHRKGRIATGFDADLLIWDPNGERKVEEESLFFRHKISPYLGRTLSGTVAKTLLRGQLVFDGVAHCSLPIGHTLLHRR
jgi:allantoinase